MERDQGDDTNIPYGIQETSQNYVHVVEVPSLELENDTDVPFGIEETGTQQNHGQVTQDTDEMGGKEL